MSDDLQLLALHGLVVKKAGSADAVAHIIDRDPAEVGAALDAALGEKHAAGANNMYMVTPAGREWLDTQYPHAFAGLRENPDSAKAYERFERVNRDLLTLMTDWQTIPTAGQRIPNDHSNADYDREIVDRLGDLHERGEKAMVRWAALVPRLEQYTRRLDSAYDKVLAGDVDYVSGARVDSYHTIWFELHEDLLRMLGREREVYE